jgi:AraC-like DNA-binding protein
MGLKRLLNKYLTMTEPIQNTEMIKPLPLHIQGIIEDLKSLTDGGKYIHSERLWMLAAQIDSIMPYKDGHLLRVAELSLRIGKVLKLDEEHLKILEYSALFHDIGKLGISETLLYKGSPITDDERECLKTHAILSGKYLSLALASSLAIKGAIGHHERLNGSGYPAGCRSNQICPIARIVAVANVYDSMISYRPYRCQFDPDFALGHIARDAGVLYDQNIVNAFFSVIKSRFNHNNCLEYIGPENSSNHKGNGISKSKASAYFAMINILGSCFGKVRLSEIAIRLHQHPTEISNLIHQHFQVSIPVVLNKMRVAYGVYLLQTTEMLIKEIASEAGFSSQSYFTKTMKKETGLSPIEIRKNKHDPQDLLKKVIEESEQILKKLSMV